MTINKGEIVRGIANESSLPVREVDRIIDRFLGLMAISLSLGEDVKLSGFGKFEARQIKSQKRRNPKSGETFIAPEKTTVAFLPSLTLKDRVNGVRKEDDGQGSEQTV